MKTLKDILLIAGEIEVLTGLHIGAGKNEIKIGGVDNPVVKHPETGKPYIPGSSIKGKMRMLLELYLGAYSHDGDVAGLNEYKKAVSEKKQDIKTLLKLFGVSGSEFGKDTTVEDKDEIAITRLSFYDIFLKENSPSILEEKTEVKINRITGTAQRGALIYSERVPAGAVFEFKLAVKVFDNEEKELIELIKKGLKLLELDSLGGSTSRGYGKIKFKNLKVTSMFKNEEKEEIDLSKVTL